MNIQYSSFSIFSILQSNSWGHLLAIMATGEEGGMMSGPPMNPSYQQQPQDNVQKIQKVSLNMVCSLLWLFEK